MGSVGHLFYAGVGGIFFSTLLIKILEIFQEKKKAFRLVRHATSTFQIWQGILVAHQHHFFSSCHLSAFSLAPKVLKFKGEISF